MLQEKSSIHPRTLSLNSAYYQSYSLNILNYFWKMKMNLLPAISRQPLPTSDVGENWRTKKLFFRMKASSFYHSNCFINKSINLWNEFHMKSSLNKISYFTCKKRTKHFLSKTVFRKFWNCILWSGILEKFYVSYMSELI